MSRIPKLPTKVPMLQVSLHVLKSAVARVWKSLEEELVSRTIGPWSLDPSRLARSNYFERHRKKSH